MGTPPLMANIQRGTRDPKLLIESSALGRHQPASRSGLASIKTSTQSHPSPQAIPQALLQVAVEETKIHRRNLPVQATIAKGVAPSAMVGK